MIYILIPSYNDAANLLLLFKNINRFLSKSQRKVVIVDDGSTDETRKVVRKYKSKYHITYLGYKHNHGPGYAFKKGFDYLIPKLMKGDKVVTMEADNSSDYLILKEMIKKAGECDVVCASPYAEGGRLVAVPIFRTILSFSANYLDRLIFRIPNLHTYSSFYRVYNAHCLKRIVEAYGDFYINEYGFAVFVELIIKLHLLGQAVCEVPAVVSWEKRKGSSRMRVLKSLAEHLRMYYKYWTGQYNIPISK